ncbi:phosphoenolpyruvate carboxylase kinase 1-like [Impatiens glandulifera]|uniref:phosphoenolpyruvate carboxylase kinase 1-like n=1 Tax=Impatiens glandulifera TaxID=253017 RepID=UPI001FB183ED|nr:phosphoenolpyruvate carboxylase kinase 1-like [Impatiens glandulifera]
MSDDLKRDYRVCKEIGRGRFGVVSRCYSIHSGESFAVKSIDKTIVSVDSIDQQCLYNEVKIMHLLSPNPNILQIFNVYEDDSYLHIVTELCTSSDLFQKLTGGHVSSEEEAAVVILPLMEAIAYCHRKGIAHRDIKPDNILFDDRNTLKLADFGSAVCFREGEKMTGVVGTPYYVAPEVLTGRNYCEKVDVWSAGVILYIMLAGVAPFHGDSPAEIFEAVLRGNLRFPIRYFHSVTPEAKDLLRRMIRKDISSRFSAEEVLRHPWLTSSLEKKKGSKSVNVELR